MLLLGLFAVTARADAVAVKIERLAFATGPLSAHVGDSIEWVNADFVAHTATARNGAWDVMIPAHEIASVVLDRAGTFALLQIPPEHDGSDHGREVTLTQRGIPTRRSSMLKCSMSVLLQWTHGIGTVTEVSWRMALLLSAL